MNAENPVQIDLFGVSVTRTKDTRLAAHSGGDARGVGALPICGACHVPLVRSRDLTPARCQLTPAILPMRDRFQPGRLSTAAPDSLVSAPRMHPARSRRT